MPDRFERSIWTKPLRMMMERYPLAQDKPAIGVAVAIVSIAVAWAVRVAADPLLGSGFPYVTFFPAIVLTAFFFGVRAGIVAAVLGCLVSWFAFIEPRYTFAMHIGTAVALLFYTFVVGVDLLLIHWAQVATAHLRQESRRCAEMAEQRGLLFEELQHRVGNNLQVVGALLSAQRRQITDEQGRRALEEAGNRLRVIGDISRQLYSADGELSASHEFISRLVNAVLNASGRQHDIRVECHVEDHIQLLGNKAVPFALILTETLNNAIEHGFARRGGSISLHLVRQGEDRLRLTITDDGDGLAEGFDMEASNSLGLKISRQLAKQLQGDYRLIRRDDGAGTIAELDMAAD